MIEKYKDEDIPFFDSEEFHKTYESVKDNPEALKELDSIMDDVIDRLKPLVKKYKALCEKNPEDVDEEELLRLEVEKCSIEKERLERMALLLQTEVERKERLTAELQERTERYKKRNLRLGTEKKIYPNEPCPCGRGLKYKKCCGRK